MYIFMKLAEGHAHGEIPGRKTFSAVEMISSRTSTSLITRYIVSKTTITLPLSYGKTELHAHHSYNNANFQLHEKCNYLFFYTFCRSATLLIGY